MSTQFNLEFSVPLSGKQLRDRGIKAVSLKVPDSYRQKFEACVMNMQGSFTSEDVVAKVGMPPNHVNAVGALMRGLGTRGLIRKTGRYVCAERPLSHARAVAEWVRA